MKREGSKSRGKAGKFLEETIEAGKRRIPEKWKKYQRKHLSGRNRKGRRDYAWRKKKKV